MNKHCEKVDKKFLKKWKKEYYGRDDREEYINLINKQPLTKDHIQRLLRWKSSRFSRNLVHEITSPKNVKRINDMRSNAALKEAEIDKFVTEFYPTYPYGGAPVFGNYLKHLIKPEEFPIYDQYVHEAFHKLKGTTSKNCLAKCYNEYRIFFKETMQKLGCKSKTLDDAFWAYGYDKCNPTKDNP